MSNNRLYIRDKVTGNHFMLAKFWGWDWSNGHKDLAKWLEEQQLEEGGSEVTTNQIKHNYEIVTEDELYDL